MSRAAAPTNKYEPILASSPSSTHPSSSELTLGDANMVARSPCERAACIQGCIDLGLMLTDALFSHDQ
eukprot:15436455-Alexandrium_andersonii.AAC.1